LGQKVKQRSTKHYIENKRSNKDTKGTKGQTTIYKGQTTDNNTSTYGAEMLQQLKETGVESCVSMHLYLCLR
jgi:hypothetical protein